MDNTIIDGRYQVIAPIGSGGEARVYEALDLDENTSIALRLALKPGRRASAEPPAKFHENWVALLATGVDREFGAYQIFELLKGATLSHLINERTFVPEEWLTLVTQSLDAVDALHASGWSHGDLNADNLFATAHGWKLLELPFLRFDPPPGRTAIFGSIHTLAPEQIDKAPPSPASDLYSLGCLYYYAASGRYPHPGGTAQEVAISRLRFDPEPLHQHAPELPPAWSDGVMSLLARLPADRPSSAAARQLLGVA